MPQEPVVRIELVGLFRIVYEEKRKRVVALAPWTGPTEIPDPTKPNEQSAESAVPKSEIHHFTAAWWPRDLGETGMPPQALTVWPLPGMELSFHFPSMKERLQMDDWDALRIPTMVAEPTNAKDAMAVVPGDLRDYGKIRQELLDKKAGSFRPVLETEPSLTDHLGFERNQEGLIGRVIIDHGDVQTDDLTSIEAVLAPSALAKGEYRSHFTNKISVVVRGEDAVEMRARNLITGKLASRARLRLPRKSRRPNGRDRYLFIVVAHLCPRSLLAECIDPSLDTFEERDDDFAFLYNLSEEPEKLRKELKVRTKGDLPVPTRYDDPHSCTTSRCGSTKEKC